MKNMKHYFTLTCSVLLILGLSMLAQAGLVGHWTFEPGEELVDLTGNFPDLTLKGAEIADGQLDVGSGKWAIASGEYKGPDIAEKTLVSWVSLDDLNVRAGSAITIDRISGDHFDGIIYAERQEKRWMSGSSGFGRTNDFSPGCEETETGQLILMVISYEDDGSGKALIRMYRNGEPCGEYTKGGLGTWPTGDAEVFFGIRHGNTGGGPGNLDAHIEEARIYNEVLTPPFPTAVTPRGKLATSWAAIKAK